MRKGHKGRKMPKPRFAAAVTSANQFTKVVRAQTRALKPPKPKRIPPPAPERVPMSPEKKIELKYGKQPATPTLKIETAPLSRPQDGEIRTDSTGQRWLYRHRLVDGQLRIERAPLPSVEPKPATEAPEPTEPEVVQAPVDDDKRPWWLRRGESMARDKKEWLAWQKQREPDGRAVQCERKGFSLPGISGPNGVRMNPGEVTTLWNRTLNDL